MVWLTHRHTHRRTQPFIVKDKMGNTQFKIPTLWLLLSFTFGGTTSSCFSFKLLALPSLKELAITPADIYYCLSRILIIKHWSRELRCQNCTDCVWSLLSADPPSSIRIRGMASLDFWLWVTSLQDWLQTLLFPADEYIISFILIYLGHPGVYQRSDLWTGKSKKLSLNSYYLAPAMSCRGGES